VREGGKEEGRVSRLKRGYKRECVSVGDRVGVAACEA
jgi:hypothetical protein